MSDAEFSRDEIETAWRAIVAAADAGSRDKGGRDSARAARRLRRRGLPLLGLQDNCIYRIPRAVPHALPHAHPTDRKIQNGDLVLVDMGAMLHGYASDMTRMAFSGKPDKKMQWLYNAVLEAQLAGVAAVKAGVAAGKVDAAAREVLQRHELDRAFVHSTGHGLGLEIHEGPRVAKKQTTKLEEGMVITIEPGAYIEGLGGVRIEDTVLVTRQGCEVLTPTSKELVLL